MKKSMFSWVIAGGAMVWLPYLMSDERKTSLQALSEAHAKLANQQGEKYETLSDSDIDNALKLGAEARDGLRLDEPEAHKSWSSVRFC